jgi:hypothetical protein
MKSADMEEADMEEADTAGEAGLLGRLGSDRLGKELGLVLTFMLATPRHCSPG